MKMCRKARGGMEIHASPGFCGCLGQQMAAGIHQKNRGQLDGLPPALLRRDSIRRSLPERGPGNGH